MTETRGVTVADLGLRVGKGRGGQHGLIAGGNGSGKSTLEEHLIMDFLSAHRGSRAMVLDSKPRFRAEFRSNGRNAKRLYRKWAHGPLLPGSVRVTSREDVDLALKLGGRLLIAQSPDLDENADPAHLAALAMDMFRRLNGKTPTLCTWDETLDFYTSNGSPLAGVQDAPRRWAQAARERGGCALFCSQRAKGIPAQLVSEIHKLYLFRLDFQADLSRLQEAGAPDGVLDTPQTNHVFRLWTKDDRERTYGPYRLNLSE